MENPPKGHYWRYKMESKLLQAVGAITLAIVLLSGGWSFAGATISLNSTGGIDILKVLTISPSSGSNVTVTGDLVIEKNNPRLYLDRGSQTGEFSAIIPLNETDPQTAFGFSYTDNEWQIFNTGNANPYFSIDKSTGDITKIGDFDADISIGGQQDIHNKASNGNRSYLIISGGHDWNYENSARITLYGTNYTNNQGEVLIESGWPATADLAEADISFRTAVTSANSLARIVIGGGATTTDIDITNANLDMNGNNITNVENVANFATGSYTGNGSTGRAIAHGLGVTPKFITVQTLAVENSVSWISGMGAQWNILDGTSPANSFTIAPDADNFYVGDGVSQVANINSETYYWVAWG